MMTLDIRKKPAETIDDLFDQKFKFIAIYDEQPLLQLKLFMRYGESNFDIQKFEQKGMFVKMNSKMVDASRLKDGDRFIGYKMRF